MNNEIRQRISTFLDDELESVDVDRLLDAIEQGDELRDTWGCYHLIGDVIRGEGIRISARDVADNVRQQLESEPAIISAPRRSRFHVKSNHWVRPTAGVALAASVAALAVLTIPRLTAISPDSTSPSPQIASASAEHDPAPMQLAAAQAPARPDSGGTRWVDMSRPRVESRLNRYLVTHNEYASVGAVNGVLPYATFVSYDTGRP